MTASREIKPKIVLVDDHPGNLIAACEMMKAQFEIAATFGDCEAALNAVSIFKPDIVILDIGMPGKDGFETARRMRERIPGMKIVFLTVFEDMDYACAARDMGCGYVVKRRMRTDLLPAAWAAMDGTLFFSPVGAQFPEA